MEYLIELFSHLIGLFNKVGVLRGKSLSNNHSIIVREHFPGHHLLKLRLDLTLGETLGELLEIRYVFAPDGDASLTQPENNWILVSYKKNIEMVRMILRLIRSSKHCLGQVCLIEMQY